MSAVIIAPCASSRACAPRAPAGASRLAPQLCSAAIKNDSPVRKNCALPGVAIGRAAVRGLSARSRTAPGVVRAWDDMAPDGMVRHVVEGQQFDRELLEKIFLVADEMATIKPGSPGSMMLQGHVMATLFYEPSTRTRLSFEAAMSRLGGMVVSTENAKEYSSAAKGESLEDTIRTCEGYADAIVMRHFEIGSAKAAAQVASVPILNAGDGPGQHPTQALLDAYTIKRELGRLDNVTVGMVGDLANGRTVRSLAYLLTRFENVKVYFVAPEVVKMKDDIKDFLTSKNVEWIESDNLMEVAADCDVLYQTRIQKERFADNPGDYEKARGKYIIDAEVMKVLPKDAIVMHPLPRLDEITTDVDSDPRAAYFRQAQNGLFIRMAILKACLIGL